MMLLNAELRENALYLIECPLLCFLAQAPKESAAVQSHEPNKAACTTVLKICVNAIIPIIDP
jgi:hypothetical protein